MLDKYATFVDGVTSPASKDTKALIESIIRLDEQGCDIARLDTAFTGLCSESGEANDLVKKLKFHGKDYTDEIRDHLIKELGDVAWYWEQEDYPEDMWDEKRQVFMEQCEIKF